MLRWWFVDGVSKSSTGASSATSSATDGELSVDGIDNCTIIQQSIGARTLLFLGEGKGEAEGGKRRESTLWEMVGGGGQDEWRRSCSGLWGSLTQGVEATINLIGILSLGDGQKTPAKSSRGRRGRQEREDGYRRREDPMKTRMMECLGLPDINDA